MTSLRYPYLLSLIAFVVAAALLAGCSGNGGSGTATPTPAVASPSPSPAASASPTATPPQASPTLVPATATPTPVPASVTPSPVVEWPLGTSFEIRPGETVSLANTGWQVRFNAITADSRCPVDVTCVWAGEVTASFTAVASGGGGQDFEVTKGPLTEAEASFGGYRLTLVAVEPEPRSTVTIAPGDYVATVVVEADSGQVGKSGVRGVVTLGPQCPVVRPDQPCPDKPYEALIIVTDAAGHEVARTTSATDGSYAIELAAGSYTLKPQTPPNNILPIAHDVPIVVEAGSWTTADVSYDTGIR